MEAVVPAVHAGDVRDSSLELACAKKSFLKLPVPVETSRLLAEFGQIPEEAWGVSHWDVHCSIDVLLLRGGHKGGAEDFTTRDVVNNPILERLPYIASLLAPEGSFGGAVYAFMFRTKPNGITRVHDDGDEVWRQTVRIHVPIVTNDGAFLLAEGRAKHLSVGEVWTFDNQSRHSVVNGNATRVHLIFDVNPNPKLAELMRRAVYDPGVPDPERWAHTQATRGAGRVPPFMFSTGEPLTIAEKHGLGLDPDGFATRIVRVGRKGALLRTPLKEGDVVTAVNDVDRSVLSRTALDHIRLKHGAGETVTLDVLRQGVKRRVAVRLRPYYYFSPSLRVAHLLKGLGLKGGEKAKASY